jgi:hypothetical protein
MEAELKWLTQQEMEIERQREEDFWNKFQNAPWQQYPKSENRKLGVGLYDQLKKGKPMMHTLALRYFSVILRPEDIPSSPMIGTIFTGAARHCREKAYGDSFSMDEIFGFKIDNKDVFRVIKTTVNGQDRFGKNPGDNEVREAIRNGNVIEVFFIEDINSVLK